jgi:glycosyltransferase involved in cell wall biosynthesis
LIVEFAMRVLHFYKASIPYSMGGVERFVDQLARGAVQLGIQTDVLSLTVEPNPKPVVIDNGYTVYGVRQNFQIASTGMSFSALQQFVKLAKQADVIHYHFPWPFMDLVHFACRITKPTVVTYHSDIIRQKNLIKIYRPLMRRFLGAMDRIVATSPNYFATSDELARYKDKVSVIPIGIDKDSYPPCLDEKVQAWRKKFGPTFFAFVGVLRYYKGLHILLEAAKNLSSQIVIVGAGPIEQSLKAKAVQAGVTNVHFLGFLPDEEKVALLHACYGVVFPSHLRSEAFGISLLEGAMFGKPLISSEIGTGTTFINIANETGLVVPPSDPIALRQAMQWLCEHPQRASEMGAQAFKRYRHHFTAEKMVNAYAQIYRELIEGQKQVPHD